MIVYIGIYIDVSDWLLTHMQNNSLNQICIVQCRIVYKYLVVTYQIYIIWHHSCHNNILQ